LSLSLKFKLMTHKIEQFYFETQDTFEEYLSNEALLCSICMTVPKQPHTSTMCCGMMILCKSCIITYYSNRKTQCPTCNKRGVLETNFVVNMRAQKTIHALRAKCLNCEFGKEEVKTLETVVVHQEKTCEFRMETCDYCDESVCHNMMEEHLKHSCMMTCEACNDIMYSVYFEEHKLEHCSKRLVECTQGCVEKVRFDKMQNHIDSSCAKTVITCHRNCGASYFRYEYGVHEMKCGLVLTTCPICNYQCERKDMEEHMKDRLYHMEYRMTKMEEENALLRSLVPMFLPSTIRAVIQGKEEVMCLADLSHHTCDFCRENGAPRTIPKLFGKNYGYHFGNFDKCLECATLTVRGSSLLALSNTTTNISSVVSAASVAAVAEPLRYFQYNITQLNAGATQHKEGIVVHATHINMVGCIVTEGPDWRWRNQSGPSKRGTILAVAETPGWIRVKWHTADQGEPITNTYRIGADGKYDLAYA
jgi:Mib_herc2